ncbi:serine hydrolase domain-containing protein [Aspergillus novofumigatus IBT 16806]|uniref:Beta-lactamase family protein n=1 Tax=Aspergillus novofumigatus (strain IBT 16806) TaxID=1392255 RepID=A0A2I1BXH0_ASPN1|nr:beta-lactamase family protein [Aspergillus novofumigatus IBT 16806]PKX90068.1 beta-lactamase family protein [Aspergillus novofumigatus IBT 16806]
MTKVNIILTLFSLIPAILAICSTQAPFYPPPTYNRQSSEVWEALGLVEASLSNLLRNSNNLNTSSYSIEITSSRSTLWSTFHTAKDKNITRPGAERVDEASRYRIASITKVFTVLGILQQHAAGNLALDDTVDKYIPQLRSSPHDGTRSTSSIQWDKISLRSLASQLSGLPRDWVQGDFLTDPEPVDTTTNCESDNSHKPCTAQDIFDNLTRRRALFAPNTKSTYSNLAFDLLGLVLANVTGTTYEEYITTAILHPLGMSQTSFAKPPDSVSVLPKGNAWYFDVDEAVENPTGGLYSSTHDMSIFLRYILANYKDIADAKLNWLLPVSFTAGMGSYYGMPWEIFRTDRILLPDDKRRTRTVTFFTKGGGVPGYRTIILLVPEYDLGITVLTAGDETLPEVIVEMVIVPLIRAADALAARQIKETYVGRYTSSTKEHIVHSTLTLTYTSTHGLEINEWISNSTDVLSIISKHFQYPKNTKLHAQLIPSGLYRDEKQLGEVWRIAAVMDREAPSESVLGRWSEHENNAGSWSGFAPVSDEFCISDVDNIMYAGTPLSEVVFWDRDEKTGMFGKVELPAFRINLTRADQKEEGVLDEGLLIKQEL